MCLFLRWRVAILLVHFHLFSIASQDFYPIIFEASVGPPTCFAVRENSTMTNKKKSRYGANNKEMRWLTAHTIGIMYACFASETSIHKVGLRSRTNKDGPSSITGIQTATSKTRH